MENYFKRKSTTDQSCSSTSKKSIDIDIENLPADPGMRPHILDYHPNQREEIRRAYLLKGPCQPKDHIFPQRQVGNKLRRFNPQWFKEHPSWLEYSVSKDAAFCLYCYVMKSNFGAEPAGNDAFVTNGFNTWKDKNRLQNHVGGPNSMHNVAMRKCHALMNQKQHIEVMMSRQSDETKREYRILLGGTIRCVKLLLLQGLAFRGHDESDVSNNQGNFLAIAKFQRNENEVVNEAFKNAPGNLKLVSPSIQKDIVSACATETTCAIIDELGNDFFAILIDESRDISVKEQMAIVLRYVNNKGCVIERFLGLVHVPNTSALTLMDALRALLARHGLSFSMIRGQGYDGASNMKGEFNGLKSLILRENKCAFYIHCFAHQLQLALVAVANKQVEIDLFFSLVADAVNIVGASCKRKDLLHSIHSKKTKEALQNGEIFSGRGLNQEMTMKRAGDTRWDSHYKSVLSLYAMFSSVIDVLEIVQKDGEQSREAYKLLFFLESFEFVFNLHLMKNILGITSELCQALQRSEQDIVNAMHLVSLSKQRLQILRDNGWQSLLDEVSLFCENNNIVVLKMEEPFEAKGKSKRNVEKVSNLHHFQVEIFYQVIDRQLQELNNSFTEPNTELLLCMTCLNPRDSFAAFDKKMIMRLAEFYPYEFSTIQLLMLDCQLESYILHVRSNKMFDGLKGLGDLSEKMVETKMHNSFPLVYLLLKLSLILPVATASVERTFSAMSIVKNRLRNRMGDEWLNDCLVTYIEREILETIDDEKIMQRYQKMKPRREQL